MKKIILVGLVLIVLFGIGLNWTSSGGVTGNVVLDDMPHYTKAICDESNFCQDYMVYCNGSDVSRLVAIDGAFVWHDVDWVDPRGEAASRLC
jgi:hypothetical protein